MTDPKQSPERTEPNEKKRPMKEAGMPSEEPSLTVPLPPDENDERGPSVRRPPSDS